MQSSPPISTAKRSTMPAPAFTRPASSLIVSPERLAHFFEQEHPDGSAYRIDKSIRDTLIFSEHNLDQRPSLLETRPDQLPQSADLYRRGSAKKAHAPLPLRVEPGRYPDPWLIRERGRLRESLRSHRSQSKNLSAQSGRFQPAPHEASQGYFRASGNGIAAPAGSRAMSEQQTSAARDRPADPRWSTTPRGGAGQRTRRNPLPAGPNRPSTWNRLRARPA